MALITTIQELRKQLPRLLSNLSDTALMPNINKAQRKYLIPILGKALLDDLQSKYTVKAVTPLIAPYIELLDYVQLPLSAYAMLDDLAFIQSMITDGGIRTASTDKLQAAHKWEYLAIENALQDCAIDGIEQLLQFLYDKKNVLPLWTASEEYKSLNDLTIKTGMDFSKQYPLYAPLYTFYSLIPIMKDVDENYLADTFGRSLLKWIKNQAALETTVPATGTVDVLKLIKKSVAFLTIKHACEHYTVRFDHNGFTILRGSNPDDNSNTGQSAASAADLAQKKQVCDREGQNYLAKSVALLLGVYHGINTAAYSSDVDFIAAFAESPLKPIPDAKPYTNGNEKRKIFRF